MCIYTYRVKKEMKRKNNEIRREKRYDEFTGVSASQLESRVLAAATSNHNAIRNKLFVNQAKNSLA